MRVIPMQERQQLELENTDDAILIDEKLRRLIVNINNYSKTDIKRDLQDIQHLFSYML